MLPLQPPGQTLGPESEEKLVPTPPGPGCPRKPCQDGLRRDLESKLDPRLIPVRGVARLRRSGKQGDLLVGD